MLYPYLCPTCGPFEVDKPMADSDRPEPCPTCTLPQTEQDFGAKSIRGYVSREGNWSDGKLVAQLHPKHPDRMVTSQRQMEQVYRKHGISLDTGQFESKEAQIAATVPRAQRTGAIPDAVGGVDP